MGALLSARLCDKVSKTLKFEKSCFFHTDSSIVYHWIQGEAFRFKPFVKNRIEEIQKLTEPSKWHHCPGKENPADILSRGISVRELKDSELWWHGPPWLKQTEQFWPKIEEQNLNSLNLELKSNFRDISQNEVILENREKLLNIDKFSSYLKLLRVTAFVFRYIYNTLNTLKKRGAVNTEEFKKSEEYWIKEIQKETYGSEIIDLEKTQKVSDCSKIRSLVPYLDDRQILRIKGRLDESELSLDEKQPILLPQNSKFTELLILREHTKNFHSGVTTTLDTSLRVYSSGLKSTFCVNHKTEHLHFYPIIVQALSFWVVRMQRCLATDPLSCITSLTSIQGTLPIFGQPNQTDPYFNVHRFPENNYPKNSAPNNSSISGQPFPWSVSIMFLFFNSFSQIPLLIRGIFPQIIG
ncbi:integrase catalytic domain-containing protein [Nephila pilipes]|uniref:Integrase catalytic domain-containing protein n=1 Tax=Nephila pilipes TaxID=299642 RepID=A0A8X6JLI7_NEPPI|nr:integrase catalytic domain-containing protein [Nephila pilipes]